MSSFAFRADGQADVRTAIRNNIEKIVTSYDPTNSVYDDIGRGRQAALWKVRPLVSFWCFSDS
jgi:hypothetical protein